MKDILRVLFGFTALLGVGLMLVDIMSYFEVLGADLTPVITRGDNPWVAWIFLLLSTFYCALLFFNPKSSRTKEYQTLLAFIYWREKELHPTDADKVINKYLNNEEL